MSAGSFPPADGTVGRVAFGFDGTMEDCVKAANYLEDVGARGTFYTNQEYIDKPYHVSLAQVKGMQRKKHIFGLYTGSLRDPVTGQYYPNWAGSTPAQKRDQIAQVKNYFDVNEVAYYNFLSVSGTGGWTEDDDTHILGPLVDFVDMMDSDGSGLKHIDLTDQRGPLTWFNGISYYGSGGDMRASTPTLEAVFDLAYATGGIVHYGSHLNNNSTAHGTDNLATFCAAVDLAVAKKLKIVTPADLLYG